MESPYCKRKMKSGTIQADNLLAWTPEGESSAGVTRWSKVKMPLSWQTITFWPQPVLRPFTAKAAAKSLFPLTAKNSPVTFTLG